MAANNRFRTPCAVLAAIGSAFVVWQAGFPEVAVVMLSATAILCTYYTAVYLYLKNDSMMGGLPQAHYGYSIGFAITLSANVLLCASFILTASWMVYLGSAMLLTGTACLVGSTSILFRHIVRRGLKSNS